MKSYSSILLFCLCITISPGHSALHVRQVQDQCDRVVARELCTNGAYEDYAYLFARCSQRGSAQYIQDYCSVNAMGVVCAAVDSPDPYSIESVCGTSLTTCSSECARTLTNLRAELGCCVNMYNTTDSEEFAYALWSLCGVEPVTEQCRPSFNLPTEVDPTCSPLNLTEELYSGVICRAGFLESIHCALASEGCHDNYTASLTSLCSVNGDGQYCVLSDNPYDQLDDAFMECPNTDSCDENCMNTLNSIISSGCCFISLFNNSLEEPRDYLSYEFWQRCGLTSPGLCEVRLNTSNLRISGTTVSTACSEQSPSCSTSTALASVITAIVTALLATVIFVLVQIALCKCHSGGAKTGTSTGGEGQEYEEVDRDEGGVALGDPTYMEIGGGGGEGERGGNVFQLKQNEAYATYK